MKPLPCAALGIIGLVTEPFTLGTKFLILSFKLASSAPLTSPLMRGRLSFVMARYDRMRKLERNKLLRKYQQEHPDASMREIGQVFNISPQRVHQLLKNSQKRKLPVGEAA